MYKIEDIIKDLLNNVKIKEIARIRRISKNTVKSYRSKLEEIRGILEADNFTLENILNEVSRLKKIEKHSKNFGWLQTNDKIISDLQVKCKNILILHENLVAKGFDGSYSSLIRYISKNNSDKDKPVIRIETKAGDFAQVDFGYIEKIYDTVKKQYIKAYVFVMVLYFSRDAYYEIVKSQDIESWVNCHIICGLYVTSYLFFLCALCGFACVFSFFPLQTFNFPLLHKYQPYCNLKNKTATVGKVTKGNKR